MDRLKTGFDGISDSDFETQGLTIYDSMNNNLYFPNPTPDLPTVLAALGGYSTSLIAAQNRDKNAVAQKKAARDGLTGILIQLANSCMTTANGNRLMLISTGFKLAKPGETTPLIKPESITLTDGQNVGELVVRIPRVKGAGGYVPQYTADPLTAESVWTKIMTTTSKYTFTNLESGKKYWCRVAAIGPYNQIVYSDAVCRVVQ